jgi:hypothetical protein
VATALSSLPRHAAAAAAAALGRWPCGSLLVWLWVSVPSSSFHFTVDGRAWVYLKLV